MPLQQLVCTWRRPHRGWEWQCRPPLQQTQSGGCLQPSGLGWSLRWSLWCRLPKARRVAQSERSYDMFLYNRNVIFHMNPYFLFQLWKIDGLGEKSRKKVLAVWSELMKINHESYCVSKRSKVSTHRVDDWGGACLLYGFTAGVWIKTSGPSTTTPHTTILMVCCMAAATVRAAHRAVVQSHWGQDRHTRASDKVFCYRVLTW